MQQQSEALRRALEAMAAICGPASVKTGPTKLTLRVQQAEPSPAQGMEVQDHEAWAEDFAAWMKERCAHREGKDDWGGIGGMLVDFGEWAVGHNSVPCTRLVLEALLRAAGFHVANGMVQGLVLRIDLEAIFPGSTANDEAREHGDGR
jgi:hypothetical protein